MFTRRLLLGMAVAVATLAGMPMAGPAAAAELMAVETTTASGKVVKGWLAVPARTPAPAVMVIHEWWGLTDYIKDETKRLADEGYLALAVDLYDGVVATRADDARKTMLALDEAKGTETVVAWADYLRGRDDANGKLGTVGFCFGGGWSLRTSLATPVDATVVYYGYVKYGAEQLASLKGPVLGHFADQDERINHAMVDPFEKAMAEAGKSLTTYWYPAQHAFTNYNGQRYDEASAKESWARTLAFFRENL